MRTVDASTTSILSIGRAGESERTQVVFHEEDLAAEFPGGGFTLLVTRPGETERYPVTGLTNEEGLVTWTVMDTWLANEGIGKAQLIYAVSGVVAKSKVWDIWVGESLTVDQTEVPDWEDWLNELLTAAAAIQGIRGSLSISAETLEPGQPASVTYDAVGNSMTFGIPRGATGAQGLRGYTGADGKGIASASYNSSTFKLTLTFTDGSTFTTGSLRGQRGQSGTDGVDGQDGEDGLDAPQIDDTQASADNPWSGSKVKEELDKKVDKSDGKGLSANDFTDAYKAKLNGIAAGATAISVDAELLENSTNPVRNNVIRAALLGKLSKPVTDGTAGQVLTSDGEGGHAWADPASEINDSSTAANKTWSSQKISSELSEKQNTLTFDSTPTAESSNPVTSGGVAAALSQQSETIVHLENDVEALPNVKDSTESEPDIDVSDEDGNVIVRLENGGIKTKEFDSASAGQMKESTTSGVDVDFSDPNGNVIMRLKDGHIKTKNFDSSNVGSGIIARNKSLIDGVYAACRWHQPSISSKQFCVLIGGDSHGDDVRMNSMVDFLNGVDALDAAIMLGDMSGNVYSDSISYYTDALANAEKPFMTVIGNHDVVGASSDADLYTKYSPCLPFADLASGEAVANKLYYYKDFASYKIRVIVLMQYDYTYTGNLCFGQDQIDWLISTLNSTPSDYGVIIAEHTNPSRYMTYNMDEKYTSSTWVQSNYAPTDMDGDPVPDIVDAWINGTTLSQTYAYTFTGAPSALSVSADFTSRGDGEFITYIGGHWHTPVLGYVTGHTDQPDWHMDAAGMIHSTQGDTPRKEGTVSEDSFCALAVDRDKKTVKVFRVGAHFTKDAVDRQYFKYSYGGV